MFKRSFLPLCGFAIFAGCGGSGSGTGPTTLTFAPIETEIGGIVQTVAYDAVTDTYTAGLHGGMLNLIPVSAYDNGTFTAAQGTGSDQEFGLYVSQTDQSRVLIFRPDPAIIPDGPSVSMERLTDANIPTSGSAVLTGDYQGLIQGGTSRPVIGLVDGDATINVNFATRTISGTVTNRVNRSPADGSLDTIFAYADLTLKPAAFDDNGAFSTDTEGGAITEDPFGFPLTAFEVIGTYRGLLAGNGDEAVIGVDLLHNLGAGGALEVGAIAAGH